jgi:hypothetical protein
VEYSSRQEVGSLVISLIIQCTCFHGHSVDVPELIMCDRMICGRGISREVFKIHIFSVTCLLNSVSIN